MQLFTDEHVFTHVFVPYLQSKNKSTLFQTLCYDDAKQEFTILGLFDYANTSLESQTNLPALQKVEALIKGHAHEINQPYCSEGKTLLHYAASKN